MTGNRVDLNGRPLALRPVDWDALMAPRTVVVVGATDTEGTQQRAQWLQVHERLTARGATVVPVHPTKPEILGTPAYPSVRAVPFAIDLAIVLVRRAVAGPGGLPRAGRAGRRGVRRRLRGGGDRGG